MSKKEKFEFTCVQAWAMLQKNKYYTIEDFEKIKNQVYDIYFNNNIKKYNYFSTGNLKLNKNIIIFNLPSIATCPCACAKCYALKAEYMRPRVRVSRGRNLLIMLLCQQDNYFRLKIINHFLQVLKNHAYMYNHAMFRLHESGDFFNKKYVNFWNRILFLLKNTKIKNYTYSKIIDSLINCNIVNSFIEIDNKKYINFGNDDYIQKLSKLLKSKKIKCHVCDYGRQNTMHCGLNCNKCATCKNVLFYQH